MPKPQDASVFAFSDAAEEIARLIEARGGKTTLSLTGGKTSFHPQLDQHIMTAASRAGLQAKVSFHGPRSARNSATVHLH